MARIELTRIDISEIIKDAYGSGRGVVKWRRGGAATLLVSHREPDDRADAIGFVVDQTPEPVFTEQRRRHARQGT